MLFMLLSIYCWYFLVHHANSTIDEYPLPIESCSSLQFLFLVALWWWGGRWIIQTGAGSGAGNFRYLTRPNIFSPKIKINNRATKPILERSQN
jgi:hypothetical protein